MKNIAILWVALLGAGCEMLESSEYYYEGGSPPTISSLSVESEKGNLGGTEVTISGSGFGDDPDQVVVTFANRNAEILSVSDSEITVVTPAGPVTGGEIKVRVGTPGGYSDDDSSPAYTYDVGPLYEEGEPGGEEFYGDEQGYVLVRNYRGSAYGDLYGWVHQAGQGALNEMLNFAYPRYHTQESPYWGGGDQGLAEEWVIQRPANTTYLSDLEELRLELDEMVLENPLWTGNQQCVWWEDLAWANCDEYHGSTDISEIDIVEYPGEDPDNTEIMVYNEGRMRLCEPEWLDTRDKLVYESEYPIGVDRSSFPSGPGDFFAGEGEGGSVDILMTSEELFGDDELDIRFPPQVEFDTTDGIEPYPGYGWAVGTLDTCFDDEDDDDYDTLLSDTAMRFEWEPFDESILDEQDSRIKEHVTFVRLSITYMSLGWFGGEDYLARATLVVPDWHEVEETTDADTGEVTYTSAIEVPTSLMYQFPNAAIPPSGGNFGPTYSDPQENWGYLIIEAARVTEYRVETEAYGDTIIAYTAGDFGVWDYDNPMDAEDECSDCLDNDGDGWVDAADPDCEDGDEEVGYSSEYTCNDGIDNDEDADTDGIDREDSNCEEATDDETNCSNGEDDDGDGWVDEYDPDCIDGVAEVNEVDPTYGCNDALDNDGDGWTDVDDPDCVDGTYDEVGYGTTACNDQVDNDGDYAVDANDIYCYENGAASETETPDAMTSWCANDADDDADGYIDEFDPDCERDTFDSEGSTYWTEDDVEVDIPQCYNGADDDADGDIDADDPGCWDPFVESAPNGFVPDETYDCGDGSDNDGDQWVDGEDPDCEDGGNEESLVGTACNNGLDDDSDGFIDKQDPDCEDGWDDDESS